MPPKCRKEFIFALNETFGPVTWVRVTSSRDARNKRENYTINLYSGSSDDDPPIPTFLSGTAQLHLAISDRQFSESGIDFLTLVRSRITETIERRIAGNIYNFINSFFIHSLD